VFGQWLQLYRVDSVSVAMVLRTVLAAFPHVQLWFTDSVNVILLASRRPMRVSLPRLAKAYRRSPRLRVLVLGYVVRRPLGGGVWPTLQYALDLRDDRQGNGGGTAAAEVDPGRPAQSAGQRLAAFTQLRQQAIATRRGAQQADVAHVRGGKLLEVGAVDHSFVADTASRNAFEKNVDGCLQIDDEIGHWRLDGEFVGELPVQCQFVGIQVDLGKQPILGEQVVTDPDRAEHVRLPQLLDLPRS
jgi:hypothetical protein